ncbi:hypothetical protein DXN04_32290 [Chitinophaga silvisoli]|uniref:Uncharacterized protein n=2 Tax=Chitinophaga silvisoli TaxID=2291814 RepID=A0A3E1NS95_9BACT|nr:hypothetical protein DXN04_32290 [Chitinophaga silvisoli]
MSVMNEALLKLLDKSYAPSQLVETTYQKFDLAFKTDEEGLPILLFLGTKDKEGKIRGERYARRIVRNEEGKIVKSHWDHKGKATP